MYDIIVGRNDSDRKLFGDKGTIFLGRHYIKMGQTTSLSNNVYMDVARSHVVMVCGKRGTGKCLYGDTLIQLADGSQVPIKELENNKVGVLSLNNELKIEEAERTEFFSRKVDRLLKLKLRSGKEIKLTPEHPLLTIKGWKPAQELKIGGRIATSRKSYFGKDEIPEHKIKLLSYLIAEGHTKKVVLFANSDKAIVEEFRKSLKKFDPSLELVEDKKSHYRIISPKWKNKILKHDLSRNDKGQFIKGSKNIHEKRSIRVLIEKYGVFGLLSKQKILSDDLIKLKKENLALFLNRLFSCDGSIYKTKSYWEISYSSSSEKLIRQIQSLLLKFEILSKLRKKKTKFKDKEFRSFELVINAENVVKFIEEIGFFGEKQEKGLLAKSEILLKVRNPNVDTIPKEIWETYRPKNWAEIGRRLGYKYPKAMRERIRYSPSRNKLLQIAEIEQNNPLYLLATSDIFWDEVTSIELLEGEFTVYDICVPGNHNFVANDIIVHNSYTLGVMAEEMANLPVDISQNLSVIILDTMGIFWTMKHANNKEEDLLKKWNLNPKGLDVKIFTPKGFYEQYKKEDIATDFSFSIKPKELSGSDWCNVFDIRLNEPAGILIERVISELNEELEDYSIKDIIKEIKLDKKSELIVKDAVENRFLAADKWGLFDQEGTKIKDLVKRGQISILDVSCYSSISGTWGIRGLVIGLVARRLFNERMAIRKREEREAIKHGSAFFTGAKLKGVEDMPIVWLMIDEAHEFLPKEGKTPATDALIQVLREGRQPGLSLVLATQQPGEIHRDVITQSDIVISHRVTSKLDIDALNSIMQSYLTKDLQRYLGDLPRVKGSAIILDDNSERIYPMKVRPRLTWHGGEEPSAIHNIKREFEL